MEALQTWFASLFIVCRDVKERADALPPGLEWTNQVSHCLFLWFSCVPGDGVTLIPSSLRDLGVPKSQPIIALENPGNTWNSRTILPKVPKVPRRRINSFTLNVDKETLNISNSCRQSNAAPATLLWPGGCDLSDASFKQTLEKKKKKKKTVRQADVWEQLQPQPHQVRLWSSLCPCCPGPEPFSSPSRMTPSECGGCLVDRRLLPASHWSKPQPNMTHTDTRVCAFQWSFQCWRISQRRINNSVSRKYVAFSL